MGFENWNFSQEDIASWFQGNATGIGSPGPSAGGFATSPIANGAVNGVNGVNGTANGANGGAHGANVFGGALNAYNENEWYN